MRATVMLLIIFLSIAGGMAAIHHDETMFDGTSFYEKNVSENLTIIMEKHFEGELGVALGKITDAFAYSIVAMTDYVGREASNISWLKPVHFLYGVWLVIITFFVRYFALPILGLIVIIKEYFYDRKRTE